MGNFPLNKDYNSSLNQGYCGLLTLELGSLAILHVLYHLFSPLYHVLYRNGNTYTRHFIVTLNRLYDNLVLFMYHIFQEAHVKFSDKTSTSGSNNVFQWWQVLKLKVPRPIIFCLPLTLNQQNHHLPISKMLKMNCLFAHGPLKQIYISFTSPLLQIGKEELRCNFLVPTSQNDNHSPSYLGINMDLLTLFKKACIWYALILAFYIKFFTN